MNELIKELLSQAALATNEDPNGEYPAHMMEKFAELIVKECFHLFVSDHDEEHDEILESIKEHFGVE